MKKKILRIVLSTCFSFFLMLLLAVWHNNRVVAEIKPDEIRQCRENAIRWVLNNKQRILSSDNYILWWMVHESALLTGDDRLFALMEEFDEIRYGDHPPSYVWHCYFDAHCTSHVDIMSMMHLPDYNWLFIYGLTCSSDLREMALVEEQMDTDYCWHTDPLCPSCFTHQLMGFRFMQRKGCHDDISLSKKISTVQTYIQHQLFIDFRVVDVYIQRILMLADSGASDRIKPVWIRRVMNAQLNDGGWTDFQGTIPLGNERWFGFTRIGMGTRKPRGDFHATAQGLFLMSLLSKEEKLPGT